MGGFTRGFAPVSVSTGGRLALSEPAGCHENCQGDELRGSRHGLAEPCRRCRCGETSAARMNGRLGNIASFAAGSPRSIPAGLIRDVVTANPDAGIMVWKSRPRDHFASDQTFKAWNIKYPGKPAFAVETGAGYLCGYLFDVKIKSHRAMWAYVHGRWPDGFLDHINGNPSDNRISNLREATRFQNAKNRRPHGIVPFIGVHRHGSRFLAQVQSESVVVWKQTFDNPITAAMARDDVAVVHHGDFARLNFPERHGR